MLVTTPKLISEYQLPRVIPQLDRLRGLAILLVMICHLEAVIPSAVVGVTHQFWIGVDLFFVLSGFLITGILWDTRDSKVYFKRFYGRRVLRIWPAYTLIIIFAFCVIPLMKRIVGGSFLEFPAEHLGPWAYLLMIQNIFATTLLGSMTLSITWSLAIEEQFYLVWPAVMRYATRSVALPCLLGVFLLTPLLRIGAMMLGFSQPTIYANPLTHGDGLLCGAMVAIWLRSARPTRRVLLLAGIALLVAGLGAFLLIHPDKVTSQYCSPLVFTAVALLSTGLLLVALVSENTGRFLHRTLFMNRQLAFLGYISYSLYLYHYFILRLAVSEKLMAKLDLWRHPYLTQSLMAMCGIGLSVLLAWISRVTIERAALSQKKIFD